MTSTKTILLVDDVMDMRVVMRITLERDGWTVLEADNGETAVNIVHSESPDVVLMDYNMPIMDGITACAHIKQNFDKLPVIIYTGAYTDSVKNNAIDAGADLFLTKPILPKDLRQHVSSVYTKTEKV